MRLLFSILIFATMQSQNAWADAVVESKSCEAILQVRFSRTLSLLSASNANDGKKGVLAQKYLAALSEKGYHVNYDEFENLGSGSNSPFRFVVNSNWSNSLGLHHCTETLIMSGSENVSRWAQANHITGPLRGFDGCVQDDELLRHIPRCVETEDSNRVSPVLSED